MSDDLPEVSPPSYAYGEDETRNKGGRPTKFTPELGARLVKLISVGIPIGTACQVEGITKKTLRNWRDAANEGDERYVRFIAELNAAKGKALTAIAMNVIKAAQVDWRAGAWYLERMDPERYGSRQTVVVSKAAAEMTDDELDAALAKHGYSRNDDDSDGE